jgi:integrase
MTITETSSKKKMRTAAEIYLQKDGDNGDFLFERKIQTATDGLQQHYTNLLFRMLKQNALAVSDFITSMNSEINPSSNHRMNCIEVIGQLSKFYDHKKPFSKMTRQDILSFLDSLRKSENSDPQHRWIGTYNYYLSIIVKFFKWLYYPNIEASKRTKPSVVINIPQLKRKEQSIYKPTDLWTSQDDLLFLKYCPSKRIKCYHMVSRDLSCRPHEILRLRIKDIFFKSTPDNTYQYAEVLVNGKTGSRHIPLINSIPYLKDYPDHEHPQPSNPNSPLICGIRKSLGGRISSRSLAKIYSVYKKKIYPKLLDSPNVVPEDKVKIKELLKKPWNPYVRRHSALTEKSAMLKEHVLRQHAGWSIGSQMPQKYLHYFGNESSENLLEAFGIIPKGQQIDQLKPKQCPNCSEPNRPDSKFCAKCRMVLTYDAYSETTEEKQQNESEVKKLKEKFEQDMKSMRELLETMTQAQTTQDDWSNLAPYSNKGLPCGS